MAEAASTYGVRMFRTLSRAQLAVDLSVAGVFLLIGLPFSLANRETGPLTLLVLSVALALRRLSPGLALAIAWFGAVFQMALGGSPEFADIAIFGVLYATARYGGNVVRWIGLGSAVLGSFVAVIYLLIVPSWMGPNGLAGGFFDLPRVAFVFAISLFGIFSLLGLSWTLGQLARVYVRGRDSRRAQLRAEGDVVVEQERNRIAREMHDVVAHSLAVVIAQADGARYARATDPEAVDAALSTISSTAREALGDVRLLLGQLRHAQGEAPAPVLADLGRLFEQLRASGLTIREEHSGERVPLSSSLQLASYRIVQEALTNALRHGDREREVVVTFDWQPEWLTITVHNAIAQETSANPRGSAGHGIAGMRERAVLSGGSFQADDDGHGHFLVVATLPLGQQNGTEPR
jgi:signal transduction histidine kinase